MDRFGTIWQAFADKSPSRFPLPPCGMGSASVTKESKTMANTAEYKYIKNELEAVVQNLKEFIESLPEDPTKVNATDLLLLRNVRDNLGSGLNVAGIVFDSKKTF